MSRRVGLSLHLSLGLSLATCASLAITAAPAHAAGADGADDAGDVGRLFRGVACGGEGRVPDGWTARDAGHHCRELDGIIRHYRRTWLARASSFWPQVGPRGPARDVVYPFGGADLVTALATFPGAEIITAISLEPGGDVLGFERLPPRERGRNLADHRTALRQLLTGVYSATTALGALARTGLSAELFFDLIALRVHGLEPVDLRYFALEPDGTLRYLADAELTAARAAATGQRNDQPAFRNFELRFRRADQPGGPVATFRHVAFNLDDAHMTEDPSLLRHLEAKGRVAAMTKAASFLLWSDHFQVLRRYLVEHLDWMVSDASGLPPEAAAEAGLEQVTYGTFEGPLLSANTSQRQRDACRALWKRQPHRDLTFRYGYPDVGKRPHLVVTRRPGP